MRNSRKITENITRLPGFTSLYLITDNDEAAIIDCGLGEDAEKTLQQIKNEIPLEQLKWIIPTHGHPDHIGACNILKKNTNAKLAAHYADTLMIENDLDLYFKANRYLNPVKEGVQGYLNWRGGPNLRVDKILRDRDKLKVGSLDLEVLHTPGHSDGSICVYLPEEKALFTGDTPTPAEVWMPWWLGAVFNAFSYEMSLQKILESNTRLFLPAHGPIHESPKWETFVKSVQERFSLLEETVLESFTSNESKDVSEIRKYVTDTLFGERNEEEYGSGFMETEYHTIHSYLIKLCYHGKIRQDKPTKWKKL
jgi:glyoxylase-like metal-dependent hydrolase (beta-lactamase superfamily II)